MTETPEETRERHNRFRRIMGLPEIKHIESTSNVNPEVVYLTSSYIPQVAPQINYMAVQGEQR